MTSETNPEVLAVCYAQGWCADANYMTKREAEAVTNIWSAFQSNTSITHFEEFQYFGVTTLSGRNFQGCTALTTITLPSAVTAISKFCFRDCTSLETVIKGTITSISSEGFSGCKALTSYTFDSGLTTIGSAAFYNCQAIEFTNDIPSTVTTINQQAFQSTGHTGLLTIPSGISVIPERLFQSAKVSSVVLPATIAEIKSFAFFGSNNMASLYVYATTPPTITGSNVFDNMTGTIYVPAASVETYKTASGWSGLASMIQAIPT